ncbi:hypothetical protein MPH_07017 [Macrophomina phaseolina MS6]|uniref:DUF7888 domain-containing protein n=1 Tax=Macrophomina phaseolina (strain MS6) TaxID=1126212 RepID=K2RZZ4_MACPH|nr:hypothetical protein MPH_07017 [Macrophomina phaseolina MS6]
MKFQLVAALLAGVAVAAPSTPSVDVGLSTSEEKHLEKRLDPITIAIIGGVTSGIVGASATQGLNVAKSAADWNAAREAFTKETVKSMWDKRRNNNEAAVCYNKGYEVSKPAQMRDLTSIRFKSGVLNTDYDCFYMWGPDNHFWSRGDGGFINLAIMHDKNACPFDSKTSDLFCH